MSSTRPAARLLGRDPRRLAPALAAQHRGRSRRIAWWREQVTAPVRTPITPVLEHSAR